MKSDNYVVIQGWMCNELELKGNELLIFALIHGFSQDNISRFYGGRKYIADTFNISFPTVDKALQALLDKQYIIKQSSGDFIHTDSYNINYEVVKKLYQGSKETLLGGSKETLHKNISKKENREIKNNSKELLENFEFGGVKQPKQNLYSKCISEINARCYNKDLHDALIDYLDVRLQMKDKPLYANSWKGLLNKLEREFSESERLQVVYQSIERGYASFFPVNKGFNKSNNQLDKPWEKGVKSRKRTEQEEADREEWLAEMRKKGVKVDF